MRGEGSSSATASWHALLMPSGRVIAGNTSHDDVRLMRAVEALLARRGIGTEIVTACQGEADDALAAGLTGATAEHLLLVGHSRGGQSALAAASSRQDRRVRGVVLLGTVVEQPTMLDIDVDWVELILGADDLVAYVDAEDRRTTAEPAAVHGERSRSNLVFADGRGARLTLLDGVGHAMRDRRTGDADALLATLALVVDTHILDVAA